jgi:hypothetical protein
MDSPKKNTELMDLFAWPFVKCFSFQEVKSSKEVKFKCAFLESAAFP